MGSKPRSLSESEIIRLAAERFGQITTGSGGVGVELGIGDDAAVLRLDPISPQRQVLTTDTLVEGVHFDLRYMSLSDAAYKALIVNLSDVNAMGGRARLALGTLGVTRGASQNDIGAILEGIYAACEYARTSAGQNIQLVGGDTVAAPQWILGFTVLGEVDGAPLLRSGAKPGDTLWYSGVLGLSGIGLYELWGRVGAKHASPAAASAHLRPKPPLGLGTRLQRSGIATAAQDLSDSLAQVALQLAVASDVGLQLDFRDYKFSDDVRSFAHQHRSVDGSVVVPPSMNPGGTELRFSSLAELLLAQAEDYELLFTSHSDVVIPSDETSCHTQVIGRVTEKGEGSWFINEHGKKSKLRATGWEHL